MDLRDFKTQLLGAIDHAIETGHWDNSLFLKNILKQLKELHEYVAKELSQEETLLEEQAVKQQIQKILQEKEGYKRVYIALYQSESDRLDRWLVTIKMLSQYSVSRPAYATEADVQLMIREKRGKSDAYLTVWVKESDILASTDYGPKDRFGHSLLNLREGFFRLENVVEFVLDKQRYRVSEQGLFLMD